ncbi:ATP-dependent DNA helicase [Aeromicrobium wangtongii]|uniref:DNA 5'-3' helicase n=1 Tax=Aeromicrobium wangtongii TaxID=2969247 RepID=A0ABY5M3G6_9ACTN|nr:ATP-dependent DNA helicase [Aeromicrobium wangtongii]MCD9198366.1 ATP-dependent DNA helicase [Aeromicrobium wangtongii]UUP12397.1 ATP-dependent DNA helicase [Aeromicrobium wangtongii]
MPSIRDVLHAAVESVGGQDRPGQIQMAEAVKNALDSGEHLLVQAGTGTGKSLGYLVPSLLHGKRVVVATATLNLQHQLVERDIPALKEAARATLDKVPHHAVVKGRGNYACLHRVREGAPDDQGTLVEIPEGSLGAEVLELREWAEEQAARGHTGDRDSAPAHNDRAWRQVSVNHRECLGASRCAHALECFAELAREDAHNAQVVVTNHALLAIDAIDGVPMLPEYDAVVVDEAHELAARVTQASTDELDPVIVERAARRARARISSGEGDDLTDASDALADILARTEAGRIDELPQPLEAVLALVRDSARACLSAFPKEDKSEPDAALQQARGMVDDVRKIAERMAAKGETEVLWISEFKGNKQLHIAPIDVSGALRDKLFADKTVVLTSATLKLGGGFEPVARSLGLWGDDPPWTSLDVGSPFDYAKQGMLYVAKHLPAPGRDGLEEAQLAEITDLIEAAGGRTLGLFSSRRGAEKAAEEVRERLPDLDIWCQGDAQLPELARRFAETPSACLFGTLSLWQGVDLPGDTCQLVIIDRIPFPRPDDPLMSARQRLVEKRGGNGFMSVAAQHAALLLAQGTGRLIRRGTDRGVVAVLDPRLVTARYGSFLTASMPDMWRTTDRNVALAALRRLDEAANAADG